MALTELPSTQYMHSVSDFAMSFCIVHVDATFSGPGIASVVFCITSFDQQSDSSFIVTVQLASRCSCRAVVLWMHTVNNVSSAGVGNVT